MRDSFDGANAHGGICIANLLTLVFIVLKLLGKITWSWLWVLAPTWISVVFGLVKLFIMLKIVSKLR